MKALRQTSFNGEIRTVTTLKNPKLGLSQNKGRQPN